MVFFLFSYISFDIIMISHLKFPLELVTGCVFLGGAVFVFIVINISRVTIASLQKAEEAIRVANDDWKSTFDAVTDMVTVHGKEFNITRANLLRSASTASMEPRNRHQDVKAAKSSRQENPLLLKYSSLI